MPQSRNHANSEIRMVHCMRSFSNRSTMRFEPIEQVLSEGLVSPCGKPPRIALVQHAPLCAFCLRTRIVVFLFSLASSQRDTCHIPPVRASHDGALSPRATFRFSLVILFASWHRHLPF